MSTTNVSVSRSGTNFTINVASCDLDTDLTIKDWFILHNGIPYTRMYSDYVKTSSTVLTYVGSALTTTTVEVRRKTPTNIVQPVNFGERMSSALWNRELDRIQRRAEEYELNGVGAAFSGVLPAPRDDAFSATWDNDTIYPPTRNSLYDHLITLAPILSPSLQGVPTAPTASTDTSSTQLATTAYVKNNLASYAPLSSPSLSGTPTAPTPAAATNNSQLATTNFVHNYASAFMSPPVQSGTNCVYVDFAGGFRAAFGSWVNAVNENGGGTLTFAPGFNGYVLPIICNGDSNVNGNKMHLAITNWGGNFIQYRALNLATGTDYANAVVRVNWVMFGAR